MIEIKTGDIPCCIYTSYVEDHFNIKQLFLEQIKNLPIFSISDIDQKIFNTDYFIRSYFNKVDYKPIQKVVHAYNIALSKFLNYSADDVLLVPNNYFWFQQYKTNDYHSWHRHEGSFSNVYFIDLPYKASKTSFRYLGKEFQVEVEEGQILTFPSFLEHCSKPNLSDKIKTVISFNSN